MAQQREWWLLAVGSLTLGLTLGAGLWVVELSGVSPPMDLRRLAALRALLTDGAWPVFAVAALAMRGRTAAPAPRVTAGMLAATGLALTGIDLLSAGTTIVLPPYLPLALSPGFIAGGLLMAAAVLSTWTVSHPSGSPLAPIPGIGWALLPLAVAVIAGLISINETSGEGDHLVALLGVSAVGHALQFCLAGALTALWLETPQVAADPWFTGWRRRGWIALTTLPALSIIWAQMHWPADELGRVAWLQALMLWALWPLPTLVALRLLLKRNGQRPPPAIRLSCLLWLLTGIAGIGAVAEVVTIPLQAHAVLGSASFVLAAFARHEQCTTVRRTLLYGAGAVFLAAGLVLPPVSPGGALISQWLGYAAMLVAALATAGKAIMPRPAVPTAPADRAPDVRWRTALGVIAAIGIVGAAVSWWPDRIGRQPIAEEGAATRQHAASARALEIRQRFEQGVAMLHARQFEFAVKAFHRVLELDPAMPEAHINMGFALLGQNDNAGAQGFFESATELRATQTNAYYGLALALENQGRAGAAAGAMRTYLHLAAPDDPYRTMGEAALTRIEKTLAAKRVATNETR